jgi:hypothetical protein
MSQIDNQSMTELADAAFQQAAKQVIERAMRTKTPIVVRENGKMTRIEVLPDKLDGTAIKSAERNNVH